MSEYEVVMAYGAFALIIFTFGIIWRLYREAFKKRFHLLNHGPKGGDGHATHAA